MPKYGDYAYFSLDAYGHKQNPYKQYPAGWKLAEELTCPNTAPYLLYNYFGQGYINHDPHIKEIIIAHRGTVPSREDYYEDLMLWLANVAPQKYEDAVVYYMEYVKQKIIDKGWQDYKISYTGHSLGAVLAELSAAQDKTIAVTFESPGSRPFIKKYVKDGSFASDALLYAENNIITFNAAPDAINAIQPHVGKIIRVYPPFDPDRVFGIDPTDIGSENLANKLSFFHDFTLGNQHHMQPIYELFNPTTGLPKVYSFPTSWPNGFLESYAQYTSFDEHPHYWYGAVRNYWFTSASAQETPFEQYLKNDILPYGFIDHDPAVENQKGVLIVADASSQEVWGTTMRQDVVQVAGGAPTIYGYGQNRYYISSSSINGLMDIVSRKLYCNKETGLATCDELGAGWIYIDGKRLSGIALSSHDEDTEFQFFDSNSREFTFFKNGFVINEEQFQNLKLTWGKADKGVVLNDFQGGQFNLLLARNPRRLKSLQPYGISGDGNFVMLGQQSPVTSPDEFPASIYDFNGVLLHREPIITEAADGRKTRERYSIAFLDNGNWAVSWYQSEMLADERRLTRELTQIVGKIFTPEVTLVSEFIFDPPILGGCIEYQDPRHTHNSHPANCEILTSTLGKLTGKNSNFVVVYSGHLELQWFLKGQIFNIHGQKVTSPFSIVEVSSAHSLNIRAKEIISLNENKFVILTNNVVDFLDAMIFICSNQGDVLESFVLHEFSQVTNFMDSGPHIAAIQNGFMIAGWGELVNQKGSYIAQKYIEGHGFQPLFQWMKVDGLDYNLGVPNLFLLRNNNIAFYWASYEPTPQMPYHTDGKLLIHNEKSLPIWPIFNLTAAERHDIPYGRMLSDGNFIISYQLRLLHSRHYREATYVEASAIQLAVDLPPVPPVIFPQLTARSLSQLEPSHMPVRPNPSFGHKLRMGELSVAGANQVLIYVPGEQALYFNPFLLTSSSHSISLHIGYSQDTGQLQVRSQTNIRQRSANTAVTVIDDFVVWKIEGSPIEVNNFLNNITFLLADPRNVTRANITFIVNDKNSSSIIFGVRMAQDAPPYNLRMIEEIHANAAEEVAIPLENYIVDPDDPELFFTGVAHGLSPSTDTKANMLGVTNRSLLCFPPEMTGAYDVAVTGRDPFNLSVSQNFRFNRGLPTPGGTTIPFSDLSPTSSSNIQSGSVSSANFLLFALSGGAIIFIVFAIALLYKFRGSMLNRFSFWHTPGNERTVPLLAQHERIAAEAGHQEESVLGSRR